MKKWMLVLIWVLALLLFVSVVVALIFPYNILNGRSILGLDFITVKTDELSYGELGDFVGGVIGTVVAAIACFLVFITYNNQRKSAEKQQFETTFFNLIRNHKECIDAIQYTMIDIPDPPMNAPDAGLIHCGLWAQLEEGDLTYEQYKKYFRERVFQGENALYEEYKDPRKSCKSISIFHHSVWFNSVYVILKYLCEKQVPADSFYTEYFYSQISRPEWWFLYDIFQFGAKYNSDIEIFKGYVGLVKNMKLFDYGYNYIVEIHKTVKQDKIYDKITD